MLDPVGEVVVRHPVLEPGQLQVGMGVDQAGKDRGTGEPLGGDAGGGGDLGLRSHGGDTAALVQQHGPSGNETLAGPEPGSGIASHDRAGEKEKGLRGK